MVASLFFSDFFLGLAVYRKDKKILQNDIDNIKNNLNNHVTDTNKKIDDLRKDMKEQFNNTDSKIDQLRLEMHTKIDSNFTNILSV